MAITIGGLRPVNPIVSDLMSSAVPGEDLFIARRALPRVDVDGAAFQGLLWVEDADPFIGQLDTREGSTGFLQRDQPLSDRFGRHLVAVEAIIDRERATRRSSQHLHVPQCSERSGKVPSE